MYVPGMKDGSPRESGNLHKVTVNLTGRSWAAANLAAESTGLSRTDVINRAIQVYAYLEHETAQGGEVYVKAKDSEVMEKLRFV